MLHEDAEGYIVCEDCLPCASGVIGMMSDGGIEHGEEEACLGLELVTADVAWYREAASHDQLRVILRGLEEVPEIDVFLLHVVAVLLPGSDGFTVEHDHVEEGVQ